jgi:hypothetical protein
MRRAFAAVAAASCALLVACGGSPGDLMGIEMSGGPLRQPERMRVTENGLTSCNKGGLKQLPSQIVLDARNVERDVKPLIEHGASYSAALPGRRTFTLRTPDGSVTWAEGGQGLPQVLPRAIELALELERFCPGGGEGNGGTGA